jgi:N-carbamoylputrescine amidase
LFLSSKKEWQNSTTIAYIIDTDGSEADCTAKCTSDDPHFYEKFHFTPGDLGFKTIPTKKRKIGTLICWDQWYPEVLFNSLLRC